MPLDAATIADQLLLGRYRVLEERGKGGFGTVSVCWDPRLMRRVAIKTIPLHHAGQEPQPKPKPAARRRTRNVPMAGGRPDSALADASASARLDQGVPPDYAREEAERALLLRAALAETRTASMLAHPNIVSMIEFENDTENAYIIMEYVEGASLAELLDATEDGLLTSDEAAAVVEAVCDALQFAHDNGVLHLDIKPDNILVDLSGRVKLADFGMAALSSVTGYGGAHGGTVGYMPPEQVEGTGVDVRTDVFAFASVMYEALTGLRPFAAETPAQSLALVRRGAADPCALNEDVPPQVADALLAALNPDPAVRPTSAEAFSGELLAGLGRPKAGRKSLARFVAAVRDDSEPASDEAPAGTVPAPAAAASTPGAAGADDPYAACEGEFDAELGPVARSFPRFTYQMLRGLGAFGAGIAVLDAVLAVAGTGRPVAAVVAGLAVAALGYVALPLGYALAFAALAGACCAAGQWAFGAAVLVVGGVWWFFVGRVRPLGSIMALWTGPQPVSALVGGYLLPPGPAALAALASFAAYGARACLAATTALGDGVAGGPLLAYAGRGALAVVSSPEFWLTGAMWVAAAAVMAALCRNGGKTRCYLGCVLSGLALTAFQLVIARVENGGSWSALAPEVAAVAAGSTILMGMCIFLFGSARALNVDGDGPDDEGEATREGA